MWTTALKGLRANRARFALTGLAIVLGVAFVAGSFVFTDTIMARFETLFSDVYAGVDATVRPPVGGDGLDASLLDDISPVEGVAEAAGSVGGSAQLVDLDGEPIGGQGPPTLGFSWVDVPALNVLRIDDGNGRAPKTADEIAIDVATATANDLAVGDAVTVATARGTGEYEIVGLASFGTEDNLAGATLTAFTLPEAQRVFDLEGRVSQVDVVAEDGVTQAEITSALSAELGDVEVVTGEQQTADELSSVTDGFGFMSIALLALAGIAVFVGAFVIQNTFRITVAQRSRELALLRALGATSGQVTRLVMVEATALGLVGSGVGLVTGIGVAQLIKLGLEAIGVGLPDGPLTVAPRTVVVSLAVGIVVTVLSALLPARRAATISPVEAMATPTARTTRRSLQARAVVGAVLTALGIAVTASALVLEGDVVLPLLAVGGIGVFLGLATLAPLVAVPAARVLSLPMRGVTGQLARENTVRQPRRTAATASALMVGIALVTFVSIVAASVRTSVADTLETAFPAELSVASSNFAHGVSPFAVDALRSEPGLGTVSPVHGGRLEVAGAVISVTGIDPITFGSVYDAGASIELDTIGDGAVVRSDVLATNGWAIGDVVEALGRGGATSVVELVGSYDQRGLGDLLVAEEAFAALVDDGRIETVLVDLPDTTTEGDGHALAESTLSAFPSLRVDTKAEAVAAREAQVDQLVAMFTGLLVLALLIALLGIANTLALSVVERTREVGLLRAIGMSRRQVRRMVRREAIVIAVFGAVLGVGIGTAVGVGVVTSLADQGLGTVSLPGTQLLVWVAAAAVAGVVASLGPARRAARLDVLRAIGTE